MGFAPSPPPAPDPALLARLGEGRRSQRKLGEIRPLDRAWDAKPCDDGMGLGAAFVGALVINAAMTTESTASPSNDSFSGGGGDFGGGGASGSFE